MPAAAWLVLCVSRCTETSGPTHRPTRGNVECTMRRAASLPATAKRRGWSVSRVRSLRPGLGLLRSECESHPDPPGLAGVSHGKQSSRDQNQPLVSIPELVALFGCGPRWEASCRPRLRSAHAPGVDLALSQLIFHEILRHDLQCCLPLMISSHQNNNQPSFQGD